MSNSLDFKAHPRSWRDFKLVYPVIARRSKGLSIGVNLNPDRVCNFDCIYCEVNRTDFHPGKGLIPLPPKNLPRPKVELAEISRELLSLLAIVKDGTLWNEPEFATTPENLKRLNDIAFSGDGEPTACPQFSGAVQAVIEARALAGFSSQTVKLVLITNATRFHRPNVREGLRAIVAAQGEIWAKLDAGTPEYFRKIDKTNIDYGRVLENILSVSGELPLNIQTCMMRVNGDAPSLAEIEAYIHRLVYFLENGAKLNTVQLYTVARPPAQAFVTSLSVAELAEIAELIRQRTGLSVEFFGGSVGLTQKG
ncbi:MAG: radical SAM protein [Chloroflexi bacterium]|uniref:Radical SAM protein n=1 Tax=Candidatus Chlorohelix allophototropha TaxID=3003348 RepID=A0A8T7M9V3_9CHLR|nr:radical SAM protein [Chloroflexota bacterium]WJW68897.1 hypothetical protein OZ401_004519 [Chloroflexota bacterium L227-S17]